MIDKRFVSGHLDAQRRDLFRARRHDLFQSCGSNTAALSGLSPSVPMGAVVLFDPSAGHPGDSGFLLVAGSVTHRLKLGYNTVGRQRDNDVVILDDYLVVSRRHCTILAHSDGRSEIFDSASLNGTFVNGRRLVDRAPLRSNDVIRLGGNVSFSIVLYNPLGN